MKSLLLAAMLTLMLVPSASQAQTYNYAYRNTPFGQAYFYRQQYGPFVTASQGFRPYPGMFPYGLNSYAGTPYYNFNYANFPFLGYPTYQFPVYQQPPQVIIQQPIFVQQQPVLPPNNNLPPINLAGNNGFGFGGNNNNNNVPLLPPKLGAGQAIPADVRPAAKVEAPKLPLPKVGPAPKAEAKVPAEPAPKAEMPRVADKAVGAELARKAVESGRLAFGSGEYGRAMELFRRAATQNPNDPIIYYLLAQTQFAVGKYREAVASLSAGMTLKADWSAAKFDPRTLYGKHAETFDEHLNQLRLSLIQFPDDATLSFLLGHQLWFDGKKVEAKPHLLRAKTAGRGASPAEMFVVP